MPQPPLQHAIPDFTCYGCGPANPDGMHLQSTWDAAGQFVIARFEPQAKYTAGMPNTMYGGTIASLIDCHSLWTAMAFAYRESPVGRHHHLCDRGIERQIYAPDATGQPHVS
jgi:hypothetical protein